MKKAGIKAGIVGTVTDIRSDKTIGAGQYAAYDR